MIGELVVQTTRVEQFLEITSAVAAEVRRLGLLDGLCVVYSTHTTAGITINENADPDVVDDLLAAFGRSLPSVNWQHREGNSPAHWKTSLLGVSESIPVHEGRLVLGTWQGIYLCEFDGPRTRRVVVQAIPDASIRNRHEIVQ